MTPARRRVARGSAALGAVLAAGLVTPVQAGPHRGGELRLEFANEDQSIVSPLAEALFDNEVNDGHLTWAWRFSYSPYREDPDWFQWLRPRLPWVSQTARARVSFALEQDAFTPRGANQDAGIRDRPHAGHLGLEVLVGLADSPVGRRQRLERLALEVGVVGPLSGAKLVHDAAHDLIGAQTRPWHQLENEPILNVEYGLGYRFLQPLLGSALALEAIPGVRGSLGNAFIFGALGLTVRAGRNLHRDHGPPRPDTLLGGGTNFPQPGAYWTWSLFLGTEGRFVQRNIFLDGNTFRDGPSVDREDWVYDVQLGAEIGYGSWRFSVVSVHRSEEFEGQDDGDEFLKATLSLSI